MAVATSSLQPLARLAGPEVRRCISVADAVACVETVSGTIDPLPDSADDYVVAFS